MFELCVCLCVRGANQPASDWRQLLPEHSELYCKLVAVVVGVAVVAACVGEFHARPNSFRLTQATHLSWCASSWCALLMVMKLNLLMDSRLSLCAHDSNFNWAPSSSLKHTHTEKREKHTKACVCVCWPPVSCQVVRSTLLVGQRALLACCFLQFFAAKKAASDRANKRANVYLRVAHAKCARPLLSTNRPSHFSSTSFSLLLLLLLLVHLYHQRDE